MRKKVLKEVKEEISKLADEAFILEVFKKNLPSYYPDFKKIKSLKLEPNKRHMGRTSAVFVVKYKIVYLTKDNQEKKMDIFSTSHSDGSRRAAFAKLKLLYANGLAEGQYTVTKPLFFLEDQLGFFYESSLGHSLYHFFSQNPQADLTKALQLSAGWLKKLHSLSIKQDFSFPQFAIANMVPSTDKFLADFLAKDNQQGERTTKIVNKMQEWETKFNQTCKLCLIYVDYHPENIILTRLNTDHLKMIDFTDVAIGDPMVDLGTFLQQFYFMSQRFITNQQIAANKHLFVASYFGKLLAELTVDWYQRINLYQAWTALRTAVFLFYQDKEESVNDVLGDAEKYLYLLEQEEKNINL